MPKTSLDAEGTVTDQMLEPMPEPPPGPQVSTEVYAMPATQAQERFWSLDRLSRGNPGLNMPMMWECTGPLNLPLLQEAFSQTVERHESLRTTFAIVDGRLSQVIGVPYAVSIPVADLGHVSNAPSSAEAFKLTNEHAAYPMDLEKGPLIFVKLLRFSDVHHMLLVTMHHIICDGASLGVLLRDVTAFYESLVLHKRATLPELPIQFADFAIWQQEWRDSPEHQASREYWRKALGNQFSKIALPRDTATDPEPQTGDKKPVAVGDIETRLIPADLATSAQDYCKRESITLNVLLMSVFSALLSRLTGQKDLLIASPTANRTLETEDLIGLFMNIQMMRVRLEDETSFRSLVGQIQEWTLGASANQQLPFEELIHDPYFSIGENSIDLPVFFLYQRSFMVNHEIGGLRIVPLRSMSPGAIFEMMFAVVNRQDEGTRLQLEYNPLHFRSATIQRFLDYFLALLSSALENPSGSVDSLSLEQNAATAHVLSSSAHSLQASSVAAPYESISEAVLRHARETPESAAVECNGEVWTYQQLADYSGQLAERLRGEGLKPGDRVGISLERSAEMLGAVLAVLRAGGAWVPLDSHLPFPRAAAILADAGADIVLVDREFAAAGQARTLRLDVWKREAKTQGYLASQTSYTEPDANSLALVYYTSDASGEPRGVAIEHGGLAASLAFAGREINFAAEESLVAASPFDSDIAPLELLLPLTLGMRVVIASYEQSRDSERLAALIERSRATSLSATSETLHSLMKMDWKPSRNSFKVLCDRASLPRTLSRKLLQQGIPVWSLFSAPETSTATSVSLITEEGTSILSDPLGVQSFIFWMSPGSQSLLGS